MSPAPCDKQQELRQSCGINLMRRITQGIYPENQKRKSACGPESWTAPDCNSLRQQPPNRIKHTKRCKNRQAAYRLLSRLCEWRSNFSDSAITAPLLRTPHRALPGHPAPPSRRRSITLTWTRCGSYFRSLHCRPTGLNGRDSASSPAPSSAPCCSRSRGSVTISVGQTAAAHELC